MIEIPENFQAAFSESAYRLAEENRKTDLRYRRLEEEYNRLFADIKRQLGKRHGDSLLKLEALPNEMNDMDSALIYLQGMTDCAAFLRVMQVI